jgi:hypothetical protein
MQEPFSINYTDERFLKLSQKIAELQNLDFKQNLKHSDFGSRIEVLESNILRSVKDYEFRYKSLTDEINLLNKIIELEKDSKIEFRNKFKNELLNFENKIKSLMTKEKEFIKEFSDNLAVTIEKELIRMQSELDNEKHEIISTIRQIRDLVDIDMPKFSQNIDESNEKRNQQVSEILNSMNEELKYLDSVV